MPIYNFTIDDSSPMIAYTGNWIDSDRDVERYQDNTFHATSTGSSNATFSFNGTGVYLYGAKRANHGSYIITIDNQVAVVANSTSVGDDVFKQQLYGTSELTYGLHQVVFAKTADPGFIDLDFVTIETGDGNPATASTQVPMDDTAFTYYDGHWDNTLNGLQSNYQNWTEHNTNVFEARATINFNGNAIQLYSATSDNHGLFSVSLDGALATTLNGTAPQFRPHRLLCQYDGLPDGNHTLTLTNLSDNYLDLDQAVISSYSASPISSTTSPSASSISAIAPSPKHTNTGLIIGPIIGGLVAVMLVLVGYVSYSRGYRFVKRDNITTNTKQRNINRSDAENMVNASVHVNTLPAVFTQDGMLNSPDISHTSASHESPPPYLFEMDHPSRYRNSDATALSYSAPSQLTTEVFHKPRAKS